MIEQTDTHSSIAALCLQVVNAFEAENAAVLTRQSGTWVAIGASSAGSAMRTPSEPEAVLADLALDQGISTHLPGAGPQIVFVPLTAADRNLGVLRIDGARPISEESDALMMAFAREGALAVSRLEVDTVARQAEALRQADAMKTALLNAISHDLKTPLASIKTSTSSLLDTKHQLD